MSYEMALSWPKDPRRTAPARIPPRVWAAIKIVPVMVQVGPPLVARALSSESLA